MIAIKVMVFYHFGVNDAHNVYHFVAVLRFGNVSNFFGVVVASVPTDSFRNHKILR